MRVDLFLKHSRLVPRRSVAREICEVGGVVVNGQQAKGSRPVKVGDLIQLRLRRKNMTVKVTKIPRVSPAKKEAVTLYEAVRVEITEEERD